MSVVAPLRLGDMAPTQPDLFDPGSSNPLYQSSLPESQIDDHLNSTHSGPSTPSSIPHRPPSRTEKRFICDHEGCLKAYHKPSRLAEHKLTHTGERPHQCTYCSQSYVRSSHLSAHLRTHLSEEDKPFGCDAEGCEKRFWTKTHLKRHQAVHDQIAIYKCDQCTQAFVKAHTLRDHLALAHSPSGSKSWKCDHQDCQASFALKQHLKAHQKTHDPNRYICTHPDHLDQLPCFSNWSALQSHVHSFHPPKCPYAECNGRIFKSASRLKDHLKVHEQRLIDLEHVVIDSEDPDTVDPVLLGKRKRRRKSEAVKEGEVKLRRVESGTAGKEFECAEEGCEKIFKTSFALKSHHRAVHQGMKYQCPRESCQKSFAHRSSLQKHLSNHDTPPTPRKRVKLDSEVKEEFIGVRSKSLRYACPYHLLSTTLAGGQEVVRCLQRYNRVYDIRRHLKSEHGVVLDDVEVRILLSKAIKEEKERSVKGEDQTV